MNMESTVARLLAGHGRTYAEELGLDVARRTPSVLFPLLCASLLYSARISSGIATEAMRGIRRAGWSTSRGLAQSTWRQRVGVLNQAGYARYQERTATMLGRVAEQAEERYRGDLRRLREAAGRMPREERRLLTEFDGVGPTGVDIFFREVQVAWYELRPFVDRRARDEARRLGLPSDPHRLQKLAGRDRFPKLAAALVRARLEGDRALKETSSHA
jgi:hypothetical protein